MFQTFSYPFRSPPNRVTPWRDGVEDPDRAGEAFVEGAAGDDGGGGGGEGDGGALFGVRRRRSASVPVGRASEETRQRGGDEGEIAHVPMVLPDGSRGGTQTPQ